MEVKQDTEAKPSIKAEEQLQSSAAPLDAANGVSDALTPPADSTMEVDGIQESESKVKVTAVCRDKSQSHLQGLSCLFLCRQKRAILLEIIL